VLLDSPVGYHYQGSPVNSLHTSRYKIHIGWARVPSHEGPSLDRKQGNEISAVFVCTEVSGAWLPDSLGIHTDIPEIEWIFSN